MIEEIFNSVAHEARTGKVICKYDGYDLIARIKFNVVEDSILDNSLNLYIKDKDNFYKLIKEYTSLALSFYNLEPTKDNIKIVLTYMWSNITFKEARNVEEFVSKYIEFIKQSKFMDINKKKYTSIGVLNSFIVKQSLKCETPYCFKSFLEYNGNNYYLPTISYGIKNNKCFIYGIQNKDLKLNTNMAYNDIVNKTFRQINSGVKKYRNTTPSFIVALALFLSYLKEYGIEDIEVITSLPIRRESREAVAHYKISYELGRGVITGVDLEKFKEQVLGKKDLDNYNSSIKFMNTFNRLKIHFDGINILNNNLNSDIILQVKNLITNNEFLQEICYIDEEKERMI